MPASGLGAAPARLVGRMARTPARSAVNCWLSRAASPGLVADIVCSVGSHLQVLLGSRRRSHACPPVDCLANDAQRPPCHG